MSRKRAIELVIARQALLDVQDIYERSVEQWGAKTADRYLDDLDAALQRIREHPDLLTPMPDLDPGFRFYRVNRHLLVCDVRPASVIVLTVLHASMDLPARLAEMQPTLAAEIQLLRGRLP